MRPGLQNCHAAQEHSVRSFVVVVDRCRIGQAQATQHVGQFGTHGDAGQRRDLPSRWRYASRISPPM